MCHIIHFEVMFYTSKYPGNEDCNHALTLIFHSSILTITIYYTNKFVSTSSDLSSCTEVCECKDYFIFYVLLCCNFSRG